MGCFGPWASSDSSGFGGESGWAMSVERPCDCAGRHMRFPDRDPTYAMLYPPSRPYLPRPVPAMHQHENERCSEEHLGIGGCPGLPHCRDWIIGAYNAGIALAEVTGDGLRAVELKRWRDGLQREFAGRIPL